MQITLVASLVFAAAWFLVLKPKGATDVAATPVTAPVTATAASTPGKTNSALDKTAYAAVGTAKSAAASASADARKTSGETAESGGSAAATATTPGGSGLSAASAARRAALAAAAARKSGTASASTATKTTAGGAAATTKLSHADRVILKIQKDLAARKAVVVLVWSKTGAEDKELYKLIKNKIDLRGGRVKTFFIPVAQVGSYDGLLAGLSLGQTPSTVVIAPNNEAKVLGGLTSVARIDRLTSSAILTKPTADK